MYPGEGTYTGAVADLTVDAYNLSTTVTTTAAGWADVQRVAGLAPDLAPAAYLLLVRRGALTLTWVGFSHDVKTPFELQCDPCVLGYLFRCGFVLLDEDGVAHSDATCADTGAASMPILILDVVSCPLCLECTPV